MHCSKAGRNIETREGGRERGRERGGERERERERERGRGREGGRMMRTVRIPTILDSIASARARWQTKTTSVTNRV